ncbi:MAG: MATE family efflux transporter, partial [Thermoanaerobaculia bacterium]|nr:MATE family efflux transporter [Thermoanaerobaculia bacterium]
MADPRRGLWALALPLLVSLSLHTLYLVADLAFVGRLGGAALSAVSFNLPIVLLGVGCALGLGSGVTAVVARRVGAGDRVAASRAVENGLFVALALAVAFVALGTLGGRALLRALGVPEALLPLAWEYGQVVYFGFGPTVAAAFFRSWIGGEGDTRTPMRILAIGALLNVVLDPVLIFGFGLGVRGAAIATVVAQSTAVALFVWVLVLRGTTFARLGAGGLRPRAAALGEILRIGVPSSMSLVFLAVAAAVFHRILVVYSPQAVAAFQIGSRLDQLVMLPAIAFTTGLVTMTGMMRGAGRLDLAPSLIAYALAWLIAVGLVA